MVSEKVLGIDLGTTNSGMALIEGDDVQMLQNNEGEPLTPSVVSFDDAGDPVVGRRAENRAPANPDRTVRTIKRHVGEDYTVEIDGETYDPAEISAEILRKLKDDAESYLGEQVTETVVTVPAYFTADQKKATRRAAKLAGFREVKLLNEPTAAAIAHGYDADLADETLVVYDFGGGTLDVSVLDVDGDTFTILTTSGDNHLGGTDFDEAIMDHVAAALERDQGVDVLADDELRANLRAIAEDAKIDLSTGEETELIEPLLGQLDGEIVELDETLTRDIFESITEDLREQALAPLEQALDDADRTTRDIDTVLLVGGSTRMPAIQDRVAEYTGVDPELTFEPDKIVAKGAALYAAKSGAVEEQYACTCGETFDTRDGFQDHLDAAHATDEHGEKVEERGEITVKSIVTRSLGTRVKDGSFNVLIEKGTPITEATGTKYYTTTKDDQTIMAIDVYQGEHEQARENEKLDEFTLTGIPEAPAGKPTIEVTFRVDDDGILHVTAEDVDGDAEGSLTVEQNVTGTSPDDGGDTAEVGS
ncbi:Hsp70 family protein [Halorientalis brevis]|uniref:Hsp70 family protein n=1 Tax=Halorientalis brevis TaxID=1126241 RepID=A0ABD6C8Z9_9EURY|nr:Hsp70 family protein [Halorientalis brevis]